MRKDWRVIIDGVGDGFFNMAKDETILKCYATMKIPTMRVYGWRSPCISLGYFQKIDEVIDQQKSQEIKVPVVRRITGGSAILHNREVTYSIVCDLVDLELCRGVKRAYKQMNAFIINFYRSLGCEARYSQDVRENTVIGDRKLCYVSREPYDIVINDKKIGGHAQRRLKNIIFQQGVIPQALGDEKSLLLFKGIQNSVNESATCLNVLLGKETYHRELQENLVDSFLQTFRLQHFKGSLTHEENVYCQRLISQKYSLPKWNQKM